MNQCPISLSLFLWPCLSWYKGAPVVPLQRIWCITPPRSLPLFSLYPSLSLPLYTYIYIYIIYHKAYLSCVPSHYPAFGPAVGTCSRSQCRGPVAQGGAGMEQSQNSQLLHGLQRLQPFNETRSESVTELIWQTPNVPCQLIPINLSSKSRQVGQWWAWRLELEAAVNPSELDARFMYFHETS